MSWEVVGIVSKRKCGGAVRRVLLLTLAQYSGHDGRDIYASVPSLARDSEIDPRTVQRNMKGLIDDGLLVQVGKRKCKNGYTNEYRLRLSAIKALPEIVRTEDLADDADYNPRQSATPTQKALVEGAELTPVTLPPPAERRGGAVSPDPRQSATQPYHRTSSSSSAATERAKIAERILAACGPGMADQSKTAGPQLDLSRRLALWLTKWSLEEDILPVVEAKTRHPRARPMPDFRFIEEDIAVHHARRLQPLPEPEITHGRQHANGTAEHSRGAAHRRDRRDYGVVETAWDEVGAWSARAGQRVEDRHEDDVIDGAPLDAERRAS